MSPWLPIAGGAGLVLLLFLLYRGARGLLRSRNNLLWLFLVLGSTGIGGKVWHTLKRADPRQWMLPANRTALAEQEKPQSKLTRVLFSSRQELEERGFTTSDNLSYSLRATNQLNSGQTLAMQVWLGQNQRVYKCRWESNQPLSPNLLALLVFTEVGNEPARTTGTNQWNTPSGVRIRVNNPQNLEMSATDFWEPKNEPDRLY